MKIRAGDLVVVISGVDKSSSPRRVVQVVDGGEKLRVEGVHQVKKHVRRGHPKSPQGGQLEIDLPIDSSNVLVYCGHCAVGVRLGVKFTEEGSKVRFCRKCDTEVGTIGAAKSSRAAGVTG